MLQLHNSLTSHIWSHAVIFPLKAVKSAQKSKKNKNLPKSNHFTKHPTTVINKITKKKQINSWKVRIFCIITEAWEPPNPTFRLKIPNIFLHNTWIKRLNHPQRNVNIYQNLIKQTNTVHVDWILDKYIIYITHKNECQPNRRRRNWYRKRVRNRNGSEIATGTFPFRLKNGIWWMKKSYRRKASYWDWFEGFLFVVIYKRLKAVCRWRIADICMHVYIKIKREEGTQILCDQPS